MPLSGLRVLSLESRRASEIETLLRKQGAEPFVAPSVEERPLEDHADAFRLLEKLEHGDFELLILMTGVGLSLWREVVGPEVADAALRKVKLLARGPKPGAVLRSAGLQPDITIPEPNTWREIVDAVRPCPERKIAVQEYGRPNRQLLDALRALSAEVESFAIYRWELPADTTPLRQAARKLARGEFDVALFTSSIQLEHLLAIAEQDGLAEQVRRVLAEQVAIASIGPIMSEALVEHGLQPDIVPESPKMGALVYAAANQAEQALLRKRGS
jgi:uroporphyrinogen-III synthase